MSGLYAVIYFALWALLLVLFYSGYRALPVLTGDKKANAWTRGSAIDQPEIITRAHHAHLNTLETLPVFAAVVLAGAALGKPGPADAAGAYVLYLRIIQSVIHLIGTSPLLVTLRSIPFFLQVLLILWIGYSLI